MTAPDFGNLRVVKIFLASPGDLAEERARTREVVDEVNRSLGRELDLHIDLLGWEDTLPGIGRPQELINADVDTCHIFLGLLWKRWGTPTGGRYTSGFEEEFDRAKTRRTTTGKPDIWLAFRIVDRATVEDPGEQLQKVIAFRQALVGSRELLFKEFANPESWGRMLRAWLDTLVARTIKDDFQLLRRPPAGEASPPPTPDEVVSSSPDDDEILPADVQQLGKKVAHATRSGELTFIEDMNALSEYELIRLHLTSKSWITARFTYESLSPHEANALYKFRDQLKLIPPEWQLVFRSLIADLHDVLPGWYWLSSFEDAALERTLVSTARSDSTEEVRTGALRLLEEAGVKPSVELVEVALGETSALVRRAALDYAGKWGGPELLPLLQHHASGDDASIVTTARERILARTEPNAALADVPVGFFGSQESILEELRSQASKITPEALRIALKHDEKSVRQFAALELDARDDLSPAEASALLEDHSLQVREVGIRRLVRLGNDLPPERIKELLTPTSDNKVGLLVPLSQRDEVDPDIAIEERLMQLSESELVNMVDWIDTLGRMAYKVLALKYFHEMATQIREDLRTGFASIREQTVVALRTKYGAAIESTIKQFSKYEEHIQSEFAAAALWGLAANGDESDADFARQEIHKSGKYLGNESKRAAVALLKRYGNPSDAEMLLQLARDSYGDIKQEAVEAALVVSPGTSGVAKEALRSGDITLVKAALRAIWEQPPDSLMPLLMSCLAIESVEIRIAALAYLVNRLDSKELESLFDEYVSQEHYYYNVVCWLDRILYAPALLRAPFRKKLFGKVKSG